MKEQKNGLASYSCDNCSLQLFSRGTTSDALIRRRMKPFTPIEIPGAKTIDEKTGQDQKQEKTTGGADDWEI